jgi:hypothetical protein
VRGTSCYSAATWTRHDNRSKENLLGVAIRCGQDRPDEYGKADGQDVKRGVITTRLSFERSVKIRPAKLQSESGVAVAHFVRDEGVRGSTPVGLTMLHWVHEITTVSH